MEQFSPCAAAGNVITKTRRTAQYAPPGGLCLPPHSDERWPPATPYCGFGGLFTRTSQNHDRALVAIDVLRTPVALEQSMTFSRSNPWIAIPSLRMADALLAPAPLYHPKTCSNTNLFLLATPRLCSHVNSE